MIVLTGSAISAGIDSVSVLRRAHATAVFVDAEALLQVAHAVALLVDHHVGLPAAGYANVVLVLAESWWADAVTVLVANLALLDRTYAH